MIPREQIAARLALLRGEQQQEAGQYEQLEQRLVDLRRNMDMRHGAMRELEEVLASDQQDIPAA